MSDNTKTEPEPESVPEPEHVQISKEEEALLLAFCKERRLNPKTMDRTHWDQFYSTPEMRALLSRKYKR